MQENILNIHSAHQIASGKNIIVAILDHLFAKEHHVFLDRIILPGCVVDKCPVFSTEGQGTWIAQALVKIAPDVKIMPVRIYGKNLYANSDLFIKGIHYAVENGASIICSNHRPMQKKYQKDLDHAIERASKREICFVDAHYTGIREDVIIPALAEFAPLDKGKKLVYVLGSYRTAENLFSTSWGLSHASPLVSGLVALMKEIRPQLSPLKTKQILLKSFTPTSQGYPLLDALKTLKNVVDTD
ncbi:S8 family serine peptidase [Acidobacteriota bacterium]